VDDEVNPNPWVFLFLNITSYGPATVLPSSACVSLLLEVGRQEACQDSGVKVVTFSLYRLERGFLVFYSCLK
jgi:hypothetical protein